MKILFIALVLISGQALAAPKNFNVDMDLSLDGKKIASPRMILNEGKLGTVTQESKNTKTFIDLVATSEPAHENYVKLRFVIGFLDKNGKKKIISEPTIVAKEGEPAKVEVSSPSNESSFKLFSLSVLAKKVQM